MLAPAYADAARYPGCSPQTLDWASRRHALAACLARPRADIICLQELSDAEFFAQQGARMGMRLEFLQRPGHRADGCGILLDTDRWLVEERCEVDLDAAISLHVGKPDSSTVFRYARQCVGLALRIRDRRSADSPVLTVATTHIHWNPRRSEVKLHQTQFLVDAIAEFAQGSPVVLAGDLNILPESGIYRYLTEGVLNLDETEYHELDLRDTSERAQRQGRRRRLGGTIINPLRLRSAYKEVLGREPTVTAFAPGQRMAIDYILISDPLVAQGVSPIPEPRDLWRTTGTLPSRSWPSDHLMGVVDVGWGTSS